MLTETVQGRPGSSPETAFTLQYRGATLAIAADDPRLAFIDLLFFGRPLPPPVRLPEPKPVAPQPEDEPERVEVPRAWVTYWKSLPEGPRRLLAVLAREQLTTAELEAHLGVGPGETRGMSILVAVRAKRAGVEPPLRDAGSGRAGRRQWVAEEARPLVLELERRWRKVAEAVEAAER